MTWLPLLRKSASVKAESYGWKIFAACMIISLTLCHALPATAAEMVSNLSESSDHTYTARQTRPQAQAFTTDGHTYLLDSVTIDISSVQDHSGNFTLSIFSNNIDRPDTMVSNGLLAGPNDPSVGLNTYTASANIILEPNTTYWVVASVNSGSGMYNLSFTASFSQAGAWTISDDCAWSLDGGASWSLNYDYAMRMSVSASRQQPIPTTNEWGMILLAILMMVSACWFIKRKNMMPS